MVVRARDRPPADLRGMAAQNLLLQLVQIRGAFSANEPPQRMHLLRYLLSHDVQIRGNFSAKEPPQRMHLLRCLLSHDVQIRGALSAKDPLQRMHLSAFMPVSWLRADDPSASMVMTAIAIAAAVQLAIPRSNPGL